jgi:hypothetical protein
VKTEQVILAIALLSGNIVSVRSTMVKLAAVLRVASGSWSSVVTELRTAAVGVGLDAVCMEARTCSSFNSYTTL